RGRREIGNLRDIDRPIDLVPRPGHTTPVEERVACRQTHVAADGVRGDHVDLGNHSKLVAMKAPDVAWQRQESSPCGNGGAVGERAELEAVDMDFFQVLSKSDLTSDIQVDHLEKELDGRADLAAIELVARAKQV